MAGVVGDESAGELPFKETEERRLILDEYARLVNEVEALAARVRDPRSRRRVYNLTQAIYSNRSLLIRDWHDADAANRGT